MNIFRYGGTFKCTLGSNSNSLQSGCYENILFLVASVLKNVASTVHNQTNKQVKKLHNNN